MKLSLKQGEEQADAATPLTDLSYQLTGTHLNHEVSASPPASLVLALTQYTIIESILPHLNNYDLCSLRNSCKTLHANLPARSSLLGGICEASKLTPWTNRCKNPQYNRPLGRCPGYNARENETLESEDPNTIGNTRPRDNQATQIHKTPFWSCKDCVDYAATLCIDTVGKGLDAYQMPDSKHIGRFVPICLDCFAVLRREGRSAKLRSTLKYASSKLRDCKCIATIKTEVRLHNYCLRCAVEKFIREVKEDIDREVAHYKLLAANKPCAGFICGKCEETITKEPGCPSFYMCVGCEDIANPSPFRPMEFYWGA